MGAESAALVDVDADDNVLKTSSSARPCVVDSDKLEKR
ncbi:hypothetical protein VRK_17390 [Vibrio sp. MEBiC08052]|nr:hypothetical protein VRK_17390 [Vibrio sp. MEBiC08052]